MKALLINKRHIQLGCLSMLSMFCCSCLTPDKSKTDDNKTQSHPATISQPTYTPTQSYSTKEQSLNDDDDEDEVPEAILDGSYNATVDYSNPNTGYSATYTLSVDVSNGQVVQINFPNDGYLDEDHISPTNIDDDGNAEVEGEEGKTYNVHISL